MNHILICGLGSIGQRHAKILRKLGINRIDAYRTRKGSLALDPSIQPNNVYDDYGVALAERPELVLVTNPTALHEDTAQLAIESGSHVFVEKPIGASVKKSLALVELAQRKERMLAVGYNMRFHPLLRKVKMIIDSNELGVPIHAAAVFNAWLPGWHPWEDYRESYAARSDLGGGATLTHMHEINYLHWLFGGTKCVQSATSSGRILDSKVDEYSTAVLLHDKGVISTLTLDLFSKQTSRSLFISFTGGQVSIDLLAGEMLINNGSVTKIQAPRDVIQMTYEHQMVELLDFFRTNKPFELLCGAQDAVADLELANQIITGGNIELRSDIQHRK